MIHVDSRHDIPRALEQFRHDCYDAFSELIAAFTNLDEWQAAGFPDHTPGSNASTAPQVLEPADYDPDTGEPDPVHLNATERAAHRAGRDSYLTETTMLLAELNTAAQAVETLAIRVRKHAFPARVKPGEVVEKLERFCANHGRFGYGDVEAAPKDNSVLKVNGEPSCRRCYEFFRVHEIPMPAVLLEELAAKGKIPPAKEAEVMRRLKAGRRTVPTPARKRRRTTGLDRFKRAADQIIERGTATESAAQMAERFTNGHGGAA